MSLPRPQGPRLVTAAGLRGPSPALQTLLSLHGRFWWRWLFVSGIWKARAFWHLYVLDCSEKRRLTTGQKIAGKSKGCNGGTRRGRGRMFKERQGQKWESACVGALWLGTMTCECRAMPCVACQQWCCMYWMSMSREEEESVPQVRLPSSKTEIKIPSPGSV